MRKETRRTFLGWIASLAGSVAVVGVFHSLFREVGAGAKLTRFLRGHASHPAREARHRYRGIGAWDALGLIRNSSSQVVHWPASKAFKLRYQVAEEHRQIRPKAFPYRATPKDRLNRRYSQTILELLALRRLKEMPNLEFKGVAEALVVLDHALALPEVARNPSRRLYELYARLICLSEPNRTQAMRRIRSTKHIERLLPWTKDDTRLVKWYDRTTDRTYGSFRKDLRKRVARAKLI